MIWHTFSGVAFVTALFQALEAFIEVFAPLLRLIHEGFLLVWCWFHCRLSFLVADDFRSSNGEQGVAANGRQRPVQKSCLIPPVAGLGVSPHHESLSDFKVLCLPCV